MPPLDVYRTLIVGLLGCAAIALTNPVEHESTRTLALSSALPVFSDITARSGVRFKSEPSRTSQKYLLETMVGGVAFFDYDGDGLVDLYFVNGAALDDPMVPGKDPDKSDPRYWNRLYRNNGGGTFKDVTEAARVQGYLYGMGAAVGDYDNDGDADLYVTNFGRNILYQNNGDGTFTDVTDKAGVAAGGWSSSACFVDYDRDGWLDLIVVRYVEWNFASNIWCGERRPGHRGYCHPDNFKPITHLVYHNNGNGTFKDVSQAVGFGSALGKGLGVAFNDFDRDGWLDIVVANDSFPQQYFKNNQGKSFTETATVDGLGYDEDGRVYAGMGLDCQDYTNDGWPDVFINALGNQKYALYRNGKGIFDYVSGSSGVAAITLTHSGWGTRFVDYDNDGWKDLFVAQGHVMDNIELTQPSLHYLEPLLLMRNVRGKFLDVSEESGAAFQVPRAGRGAAFGDLDNDGKVDVAIYCNNQPGLLLHNEGGPGRNWLLVNTRGTTSNRDGIGAQLRVVSSSGLEQHALVSTAGSYMSASDKRVHFGLGTDVRVRLLEITWPSGVVQRLENIDANQVLEVREPGKTPEEVKEAP